MVFISRLKLRNFKSFKAADIQLPESFICFAGPNGSGKCVDGETEIYLADGTAKTIQSLVDDAMERGHVEPMDDGCIAQCHDSPEVLSLDTRSMKIENRKIAAFVRRTAPERMLKVMTRSGREIVATEYHPFFIFQDESVKPIRADQLKTGIRIAIPRALPVRPNDTLFLELLDLIEEKDNVYVPYNEKAARIIIAGKKGRTWTGFEEAVGVPKKILGSFIHSKQSILFPYLVRALRLCGLTDLEIADIITEAKSDGKDSFLMPWRNSDKFCRFLGYLLSEGSVSRSNNQIRLTNGSDEVIDDYAKIAKELFGLEPHIFQYKEGAKDVIINSVALRNILLNFGMDYDGAGAKSIPELIFRHSTDENLANLLIGIYSGDGYVSKVGTVDLTLKSVKLIKGVERILLRFGIVARTKKTHKRETTAGFEADYLKSSVSGAENLEVFSQRIPMMNSERRTRLADFIGRKANPNVDLIEANSIVRKAVKDVGINVKKAKKAFPRLDAYCYNQCLPSRHGIKHIVSNILLPVAEEKNIESDALSHLARLADSDIFWDEIESIETIEPRSRWVYDLTISEHHNFIANGVFVHNSNVCDAIRFAMGESSLKSLRAKKVKDLIHTGSKTAEVSIVFENPDDPDSSYEIKRAIREDGKIRYRLNGDRTTRGAIIDALKKHNLDDSGRNIIAQGEVQRIIDMNGKERRGIIDSVAGIADFEDKKKEAMGELNLVKDRIKEAQLVMGERKAFLDELGREKETALRYLESKKTLTNSRGTLLKREVDRIGKEHTEAISAEEKLLAAKSVLDADAERIEKDVAEVEERRNRVNNEIQSKQKTNALIRKLEELKASCASKKQIIDDNLRNLTKSKGEEKELADTIEKEKAEIDAFAKELSSIRSSLKEAEAKLALHGGVDDDGKTAGLRIQLEAEEKEMVSLRERLSAITSEAQSKKELIEAKNSEMQSIAPKSDQVKDQDEDDDSLRRQIAKLSHELEQSFSNVKEINARMSTIDKEMLELREKAAIYRVSSSPQLMNPALRFIAELAKTKGSGIYGTVADLISFEPKYSQAVEAAGGARLMYVVVDSMETASGVIDKLKKAREGRATFIPLDTIRPPQVAKANGRSSVLEVIDCKEEARRAVEYVFAETLLVDTMQDARKIGIGSSRMVTLEGEIFERSGVVSGGRSQSGILAGNQARKIDSELAAAKSAKESMIAELNSIREDESKIRSEKAQLEIRLKTIEMRREMEKEKDVEREGQERRKDQLRGEIDDLIANIKDKTAEKEKLAKNIAEKEKRIAKFKEDIKTAEEESRKLYDESNKIRADLSAAVSSLRATIEGKKSELELRKGAVKAKEDGLQKLNRSGMELAERIAEVRKQMESEGEELIKLEETIKHASKEIEKLFEKMKNIEEEFQGLGKKRGEKRLEIEKVGRDLNLVGVKKATAETRLEDLKTEFESYKEFESIEATKEELNQMIKESEFTLSNIGNVNMTSIEMFDKKKAEIEGVQGKIEQLDREREAIMAMMDEIEIHKKEAFFEAFNSVSDNFTKLFTYINIGQGHLFLNDPANPFESGMFIKLRRNNQDHSLDALSGGEKTFVALMFAFALQLFKPAPFYILDEVDSALDKPNSKNLAELVTKLGAGSQFILVTHNDIVMSNSDTVIGVARTDGVSRLVGIKLKQVATT